MSLDIRVVHDGPLYGRLMNRWHELQDPPKGYISAQILFLATPTPVWDGGLREAGGAGVWFIPILVGMFVGPQEERVSRLAQRLLEATLRFIQELDGGEPDFLGVPDLPELWPKKP